MKYSAFMLAIVLAFLTGFFVKGCLEEDSPVKNDIFYGEQQPAINQEIERQDTIEPLNAGGVPEQHDDII